LHFFRQNLVETTWSSSEITALDLGSLGVNNLCKGILLKEERVENLVAVLSIHIASTTDFIRAYYT